MATANAATTFLENRLLSFIFKNNAASFSSPGDSIYVGLATAVSNFNDSTGESGDPTITEATFTNYARVQVTASNWTLTAESADTQTIKNAANTVESEVNASPCTAPAHRTPHFTQFSEHDLT